MSADWQQQAELEQERRYRAEALIRKAQRSGHFTDEEIQDMQREFGLSTRETTHNQEH